MINNSNRPNERPDFNQEFPIIEEYYDCAGKKKVFQINNRQLPNGWFSTAIEQQSDEHGYQIEAFSATSPYLALGEIRKKIRKVLSVKYLDLSGNSVTLTHEKMCGSLVYDRESESHGLLVDGRFISMDELETIISGYEGWEFYFSIHEI